MILKQTNAPSLLKISSFIYVYFNIVPFTTAIDASIKSEIIGEGFHRILNYHVDTGNFHNNSCHIAIFVELPVSLYVNTNDLAELRRIFKTSSCSEGEVDVELFAEKASGQNITICSRLTSSKKTLTIPINQRYHTATITGETVKVALVQPKLLIGCRDRLKEHRVSKIKICWPCIEYSKKWREIPYKWEGDNNFIWQIPVGKTSQKFQVTCITLFVTILGAAYVLHIIQKSYKTLTDIESKDN